MYELPIEMVQLITTYLTSRGCRALRGVHRSFQTKIKYEKPTHIFVSGCICPSYHCRNRLMIFKLYDPCIRFRDTREHHSYIHVTVLYSMWLFKFPYALLLSRYTSDKRPYINRIRALYQMLLPETICRCPALFEPFVYPRRVSWW
jgi:hypothetical protein